MLMPMPGTLASACYRRTSKTAPLQEQACVLEVLMTGSAADGPDWQPHSRSKDKRRKLANRFKDAKDPFKIMIVRDMWLTGFEAPLSAYDARRQTDAGPRTHGGHRLRESRFPRQARRPGGGLPSRFARRSRGL